MVLDLPPSFFLSFLFSCRYGETGIYRSHLFGHPVIVTCSPDLNKQVLGSLTEEGTFSTGWPSSQLLGNSVANIDGTLHKRIRKHLMQAFNSPTALDSHLNTAQPIFVSTLEDWASKKKIVAYNETKIVSICFLNSVIHAISFLEKNQHIYKTLGAGSMGHACRWLAQHMPCLAKTKR